jgi:8-oxo-dGTP pyrophosphatase MutT (NUDIX family)
MRLLAELVHPQLSSLEGTVLRRHAARAIVLRGREILLLYTERYNDFSFPGGGVAPGEDMLIALRRELWEETGATHIVVGAEFGSIEEYRPHWKAGFDLMHMTSHFFLCEVDPELGEARMEGYELENGMRPVWIDLGEAIAHNQGVLQRQEETMGLSILRETLVLERVADELLGPMPARSAHAAQVV